MQTNKRMYLEYSIHDTSAEVNIDIVVRDYSNTSVVTGLARSAFHDQDVSTQPHCTKVLTLLFHARSVGRVSSEGRGLSRPASSTHRRIDLGLLVF